MSRTRFAPSPPSRLNRRAFLGGAGLAFPLTGCAGTFLGTDDPGLPHRSRATPQIGLVIFELVENRFPFHTAAIIDAPDGRVLYDPGGWWRDDQGQRVRDVTHGLTPAREEAYLQRDYFGAGPGDWRVHRFDRNLTPAQASRAVELAQEMPPVASGMCCWALTTFLRQMPLFADVGVWWLPGTLLGHFRERDDLRYTTRLVPDGPGT